MKASYVRLFALCVIAVPLVSTAAEPVSPPNPPVIFVHYDYMASDALQLSFAPKPENIARVVEVFRRHGIQLVIDPQHTVLPYHQFLSFGPCPSEPFGACVNFFDLKARYFHPKGNLPWHYAIFGALGLSPEGQSVTGMAELPGYDFMVTPAQVEESCPENGIDPCQNIFAGTFMHELGHNLDLHHGGDDDENYKPNYLSVMNYWWQQFGIYFSDAPGSVNVVGLRLDYSSMVLPTLDEQHLDETVGLGGPSDNRDISTFADTFGGGFLVPVAIGPIDWNQNGSIESDVAQELNNYYDPVHLSQFHGFDDWSHIQQWLRTPAYVTGHIPRGPAVP